MNAANAQSVQLSTTTNMLGEDPQTIQQPQQAEPDKYVDKTPKDKDKPENDETKSQRSAVKRWCKRIKDAKEKWDKDFERMRENMDFVAGLQWSGQKYITYQQYIVNMTLRTINQRVAQLYARDPKVSARARERMNYQIWDEREESLIQAMLETTIAQQQGLPAQPQNMALLTDFQQGHAHLQQVRKVGETLEKVYMYQQDTQEPRFKVQMKQLVRRASVAGVGYIKVAFCRDYENEPTQSETRLSVIDRAKAAKRILERMEEGKIQPSDAEAETLRNLVASLQVNPLDAEAVKVKERLIFDFPQPTAIIPDENCRMLRGFVGADWIAEEYNYSLEFVNAYFEKDITPNADVKEYGPDAKPIESQYFDDSKGDFSKSKVRLWQVYDLKTKSTFIVCDGYKDYIVAPEAISPSTKGFWQIFPVTFNDIEVVDGCKATIFPPSDVDLIKHPQKEYNRTRNAMRRHRVANRPMYVYPEGTFTEEDKVMIENADEQEFFGLKGVPPGTDMSKVLAPLNKVQIDASLYDTGSIREDILLGTAQQESNIGPAQPNVTATVGTIAEQSRMSVTASDVDGLDDSLTDVAKCGGEMLLREMSTETVKEIAGPGAVWPEQDKETFINEIELEIVAASSGRPNKAIEIGNWERIAPLIMQAVSMPAQAQPTIQAMIRESIKRYDDRLRPEDFFPLPVPQMTAPPSQSSSTGAPASKPKRVSSGNTPLQPNASGAAVPLLAGASQ